jgi:predicted Zn-dependent protease
MMQRPPTLYSSFIRIERRCLLNPPETVKETDVQWPELCYSLGTRQLKHKVMRCVLIFS